MRRGAGDVSNPAFPSSANSTSSRPSARKKRNSRRASTSNYPYRIRRYVGIESDARISVPVYSRSMYNPHDSEEFPTLVIGGGQAGLAVGYYLAQRGIPFQILDANQRTG